MIRFALILGTITFFTFAGRASAPTHEDIYKKGIEDGVYSVILVSIEGELE